MSGSKWGLLKDLGALNLGRERLFRVIFMITGRCPLQCKTCRIGQTPAQGPDPAIEEIEAFFEGNDFSWINLTGGEIFLRDDMKEIFCLIARTQPSLAYLTFPTSGFLVERTLEGVERALEAGLPVIHVTVSFDGGRKVHDAMRGMDGSFDRARETFSSLKKLAADLPTRLNVHPGMTLSAELLEMAQDPVGDLLADLDLGHPGEIHVNLAHGAEHYYGTPAPKPLPAEAVTEQLERLMRSRRGKISSLNILESLYLKGARTYLASGAPPLTCKACAASVFIDYRWSVFPCTVFPLAVGNLKDHDFDLVRLSSTASYQQVKAKIEAGNCPGCWTPCEAYTAIAGNVLRPAFLRLAFS
ncbi:MAG: radical SAM protein [Planctomycetota bacterium]|jgi:MoaA/NifB/PqqE/SkfB family radical SAM enzyme